MFISSLDAQADNWGQFPSVDTYRYYLQYNNPTEDPRTSDEDIGPMNIENPDFARARQNAIWMTTKLRQDNFQFTKACARQVSMGQKITVSRIAGEPCYKVGPWTVNTKADVLYQLSRTNDEQIQIDLPLDIVLDGSFAAKVASRVRNRLAECFETTTSFWNRYGVVLNIHPKYTTHRQALGNKIVISDEYGRSNSNYWYTDDIMPLSGCGAIAHELGHLLGLPDNYEADQRGCTIGKPMRDDLAGPIDLMRKPKYPIESAEIYPDDFKTVIAPLCPNL